MGSAGTPPPQGEEGSSAIEAVIEGRERDVGGFSVRRVLPSRVRRLLGPFIFFDHLSPVTFPVGAGLDVRPHPHINLATVTYLFEGEILHRDSLGSVQAIRVGDVNWMLAGRGIAHSERTDPDERRRGARLHGIQSWVALPLEHEEDEPSFAHHDAATIPRVALGAVRLDVIAGAAFGVRSPVRVLSPTLYVHASFESAATLEIGAEHEERGVYVVDGSIACEGNVFQRGALFVLRRGGAVAIRSEGRARTMIVGGAPLQGERHVWWNFASSSLERIERAKDDWRNGRFGKVVGDEAEYIPLPD